MQMRTDKRSRLIDAADRLFHEKGFSQTTLANIAEHANVPLGNVYYYFRSKELILQAVVDHRTHQFNAFVSDLQHSSPKERIKSFISRVLHPKDTLIQFGDAVGGLSQELGRLAETKESHGVASLMENKLQWLKSQFSEMGKHEKADSLSAWLLSQIHGLCILAVTLKDKPLLERQSLLLHDWVEQV